MLLLEKAFVGDDFAVFSECKLYRYALTRTWNAHQAIINWLMLNPSTADQNVNDRTIAKCCKFTKTWGFGGLVVTNIFAYRSTDPDALYDVKDPIGEHNDEQIKKWAGRAAFTICAWGEHGAHLNRAANVMQMLKHTCQLNALKINKGGYPGHPLYLKDTSKPMRITFEDAHA